jgi:hypothetical protein
MRCYAWAFLSNHAHFLFRTGNIPISTGMRRKWGFPLKLIAAKLEMIGSGVGYAVERGARIVKDNDYFLYNS